MFVDPVKLVESPERVISTLVWLDCVDSVYDVLPHSLYFSSLFGFVIRGAGRNGKGGIAVGDITGSPNEFSSKIVQARSKILKHISDNQRDAEGNLCCFGNLIDCFSRLRIAVSRDFIWVGTLEGENQPIQVIDVLLGPFNFEYDVNGRHAVSISDP